MLTNSGRLKAAKEDWVVVEEFESKPEWEVVGLVGAHVANLEAHLAQVEAERILLLTHIGPGATRMAVSSSFEVPVCDIEFDSDDSSKAEIRCSKAKAVALMKAEIKLFGKRVHMAIKV